MRRKLRSLGPIGFRVIRGFAVAVLVARAFRRVAALHRGRLVYSNRRVRLSRGPDHTHTA